jgi:hypothetical protein
MVRLPASGLPRFRVSSKVERGRYRADGNGQLSMTAPGMLAFGNTGRWYSLPSGAIPRRPTCEGVRKHET